MTTHSWDQYPSGAWFRVGSGDTLTVLRPAPIPILFHQRDTAQRDWWAVYTYNPGDEMAPAEAVIYGLARAKRYVELLDLLDALEVQDRPTGGETAPEPERSVCEECGEWVPAVHPVYPWDHNSLRVCDPCATRINHTNPEGDRT